MKESEETPANDISDQSESKLRLPHCPSSFQSQLSKTWGSKSNPEVELRSDSAAGAVSTRIKQLSAAGKPSERYILKGEVGRGGMGAILKIFDGDLRRELAMKVVLTRNTEASEEAAESEAGNILRFIEEAQVTGQLDHPGVVPVHELGVDQDGQVYFTMRLVKGQELGKVFDSVHADDPDWNMTRALGVLLKVCEAMSYAHEKGVVHRDLKPANIMVGRHGAVYVMDWGLAKVDGHEESHDVRLKEQPESISVLRTDRLDLKHQGSESPVMTMDGAIIGTPFYMPPEQAAGRLAEVGPHSDVYSLGAMLYHLLSGCMPFYTPGDKVSPYTVLARVQQGSPTLVHELAPSVAPELVAICEKAMEREASNRYSNMGELAEDLRAYLENRVVLAYRTGAVIELRKWVQRNKGLAAMILAFIVLSVGGSSTAAVVFGAKNETIQLARDEALDAELQANARAEEFRQVADFQSEQLGALDVELMGVRLRRAMIDAVPEDRREQLALNLAGLNFTNLALGSLSENLFSRTITAIDTQFEEQPLVQAQLLQSLSITLESLGLPSKASDPQERALAIRRRELGNDHPSTLSSVNAIGHLFESMGQLDPALAFFDEALQSRLRTLGPDHPGTLLSMNNMGYLLFKKGRYDDASYYFTEALRGMRKVLGSDHPTTLSTLTNMAALLKVVGKYEDAVPLYAEAIESLRRVRGIDHPETLGAEGGMGSLLHSMGESTDAQPYYIRALEGSRRVLGDDHPSTLAMVSKMGSLMRSMGMFEEALPYYFEALGGMRQVLGDNHPDTLNSANNMGALLSGMGRYEDALFYYTEALEGNRRVLGDDHPASLNIMGNIGLLLQSMGKPEEALPFYAGSLEGLRRVRGNDHPDTLSSIGNMGYVLQSFGKYEEALPYLIESLNGRRRVLGIDHPETLLGISNLGALLQLSGKYEDALPYCMEALEGRRRTQPADHPDTLSSLSNMGTLLQAMGKYEDSMPYLTATLEGQHRALGANHPDTLFSMSNMGVLLQSMGRYEDALPYLTKALKGRSRMLGNDHPATEVSRTLLRSFYENWFALQLEEHGENHPLSLEVQRNQAIFFANSRQEKEAEALLLDCLDKRLAHQGEEHPDTLQVFHDLATLYSQQGRTDQAEGMYRECLDLRMEALGESDPNTLESLEGLVRLFADQERYKEAAPRAKRLLALTPEESPTLAGRQELLRLIESKQVK